MNIQEEYIKKLGPSEKYVLDQMRLLQASLDLTGKEKGSRHQELSTLLCQIISFTLSVVQIARGGKIPETYLLSRCILDTSINYSYMLTCDQDEFDRFLDFSRRNIARGVETRAKALEAVGTSLDLPNIREIPPFTEVFEKFTSPKKRVDLTKWETEKSASINKKLEIIATKVDGFNIALFQAAVFFIYEDASEIAHGTLYGSTLCTGLFYGTTDFASAVGYAFGIIRSLYLLVGSIIDSVISVIHSGKPIDEIVAASRKNFVTLGDSFQH